ncbi:hypothetical protein HOP50_03g23590 [Chloropicon primus]|uniref:Uncharacterized protein n=1 Tax=Chloropicon primus TaxID=1764295 RepID=A0A5B8MHC4_9CHLO|nr:hypothetical protein A3770_03p23610 [Chloropicon primus]UPQ99053.1 hypothetical protein HOP50_03g23590 [Chloropicon primus]|eukprot:QDZ19843.1 hypothetical protein A3770_03p23610 [Chloropicon primus]
MVFLTAACGFFPETFSDLASWMSTNWMHIHFVLGWISVPLLLADARPRLCDWLAMLLASLYCSHQFEEHGYDIFGRRYEFVRHLGKILGCDVILESTSPRVEVAGDCGYDESTILYINVYAVMGLFLMPLFLPENQKRMLVLMNAILVFVNAALFHIIAGIVHWEYNPGLCQSLLLNAPASLWVISRLTFSRKQFLLAFLVNGLPGQVVLALGPMVAQQEGVVTNFGQHALQFFVFFVLQPAIAAMLSSPRPSRLKQN